MNRLRGLVAAAGVACGLLAAAAAEALPPVMDRIPADALVVVATPSLERLDKSAQTLNGLVNAPTPIPSLRETLAMGGMKEGVDLTKSAALVVMPGDMEAEQPPIVVLVPTTDYAAFLSNFDAKPGAAGAIVEAEVHGEPAYFRDLGNGYALMSPMRPVAEAFTAQPGNAKAHEQALGPSNRKIADEADLVVIANIAGLRPLIEPKIEGALEEMVANSPMAMMGQVPDTTGAAEIATAFVQQTRTAVAGLRVDGTGVAVDLGAQYIEGTFLANAFAGGGQSGSLLSRLPAMSTGYFFAFAADLSNPAVKQVMTKIGEMQQKQAAAAGAPDMPPGMVAAQIQAMDGAATVIGASPGAIMGMGLMINSVSYWKSSDPAKSLAATREALEKMNGQGAEGVVFQTTYTQGASTVNNVPVDAWEIRLGGDVGNSPEMAQGMAFMFGPQGGPAGYIAATKDGVVQTYSKNPILMGEALKAANGEGGLGADEMIKLVQARLPEGRMAEAYIGMKSIMDTAKGLLAMLGGINIDVPEQLPPVGMGLAGSNGAARAALFVPAPVIKAVSDAIKAAQAADDEDDQPAPRRGTGQPRF
jgi:hypothetical protein